MLQLKWRQLSTIVEIMAELIKRLKKAMSTEIGNMMGMSDWDGDGVVSWKAFVCKTYAKSMCVWSTVVTLMKEKPKEDVCLFDNLPNMHVFWLWLRIWIQDQEKEKLRHHTEKLHPGSKLETCYQQWAKVQIHHAANYYTFLLKLLACFMKNSSIFVFVL